MLAAVIAWRCVVVLSVRCSFFRVLLTCSNHFFRMLNSMSLIIMLILLKVAHSTTLILALDIGVVGLSANKLVNNSEAIVKRVWELVVYGIN